MSRAPQRIFEDAFKVAVIARLEAGEAVAAVARDLQLLRKDLYTRRAQVRAGGIAGLHKRGRPPRGECAPPAPPARDELTAARLRIAELERKIGQQQIDLDFCRGALRRVRTASPPIGASGERAASPSPASNDADEALGKQGTLAIPNGEIMLGPHGQRP